MLGGYKLANILVTVGTTSFDRLIKQVIDTIDCDHNYIFQVSENSEFNNYGNDFFAYSEDFSKKVSWADVIITHAGAGSVYDFLEKRKKIIVVPNLERVDKHQSELSNYVEVNNLALCGCAYSSDFSSLIRSSIETDFSEYKKVGFFYLDELYSILGGSK